MFKTYNKENNTYSRYIHISEIEAALEKMKKISSRIQYKSIDDIPEGNQISVLLLMQFLQQSYKICQTLAFIISVCTQNDFELLRTSKRYALKTGCIFIEKVRR